jgi:hypothetical protein
MMVITTSAIEPNVRTDSIRVGVLFETREHFKSDIA